MLEDGTRLVPFVNETEHGEYAVDLAVNRTQLAGRNWRLFSIVK